MREAPRASTEYTKEAIKKFLEEVRDHLIDFGTRTFTPEEAARVSEMMHTHFLKKKNVRGLSPFEAACAFDWAAREGALSHWVEDSRKTFGQCYSEFERAARKYVEQITGLMYTTHDGAYSLEQIHYPANIERMGGMLNVCLRDLSRGGGLFYAPLIKIPAGKDRAPLELFVVRPRAAEHADGFENPDPVLVLSYDVEARTILEIEIRASANGIPSFVQHNSPLLQPLLEMIRAMRSGEIPNMPVDVVGGLTQACAPGHVLYDTGEIVPLAEADSQRAIAGGTFSIHKGDSLLTPRECARIARDFPVSLDMSQASAAQKAAIGEVRGYLTDMSPQSVRYAQLSRVGVSLATNSERFSAPCLESIGMTFSLLNEHGYAHTPRLSSFFLLRRPATAVIQTARADREAKSRTTILRPH